MNSIVTQRFIKCHQELLRSGRCKSGRQIALLLDCQPQNLAAIVNMKRDVTIEIVRKAVEKFRINPVYLFTGDGGMFLTEADSGLRVLTIVTDADNKERIVHVPARARAGYPIDSALPAFIKELPTFSLPDAIYQSGSFRSFEVAGDSMEPTILDGDKLVCSFIEPEGWGDAIKPQYVYVVVTKDAVLAKRLEDNFEIDGTVTLLSDNQEYPPVDLPVTEIKELWLARTRITPALSDTARGKSRVFTEVNDLRDKLDEQTQLINQLYQTIAKLIDNQ